MSRLDELIAELCPDGVDYKTLGEVADAKTGRKPIYISEEENGYEYINAGTTNSGYTNSYNCEADTVTTPSRGQGGIGFVGYQSKRFWLGPLCYQIRAKTSVIMNRFIYYVLQSSTNQLLSKKNEGGTPSLNQSDLLSITIPVPPLPVQREIVRILDHFTELTAELTTQLTAELTARQKQYYCYRDSLLNFGSDTQRNKLGNICSIKGRIGFRGYTQKDFVEAGKGAISLSPGNIISNHLSFEDSKYISWEKYRESPEIMISEGDIVLCKTGSTVGKVAVIDHLFEKATINPQLVVLKNIMCNTRYLFYQLSSTAIQYQIKSTAGTGSVPNISQKAIAEIDIPLPTIEVQLEIVDLLDQFDTLCNDITNGLPAEIAARQKQYEYYRDKLLSFKEWDK